MPSPKQPSIVDVARYHKKVGHRWIRAYLIVESLCHADSTSWEVWIIILSLPHNNSCWGITVSSEKGKYVVLKESHDIKRFLTHPMNIHLVGTQNYKAKEI
jgi:hypothetical protein